MSAIKEKQIKQIKLDNDYIEKITLGLCVDKGHRPTDTIKKYSLSGEEHFKTSGERYIVNEIDHQKMINSVYETTLDYVLKSNPDSSYAKDTISRLISRSKSATTGELFDHNGKKLTDRTEIKSNINKINEQIIKNKVSVEKAKETIAKIDTDVIVKKEKNKGVSNETK